MQSMVINEKQWYAQIKSYQPKVWKVSDGWRWKTTTEWIKATLKESWIIGIMGNQTLEYVSDRLLKVLYFGLFVYHIT